MLFPGVILTFSFGVQRHLESFHVFTYAFSNLSIFILLETHQNFCVQASVFVLYLPFHTATLKFKMPIISRQNEMIFMLELVSTPFLKVSSAVAGVYFEGVFDSLRLLVLMKTTPPNCLRMVG